MSQKLMCNEDIKMTKTYITNMPDKAGEFLKASQVICKHHGNITRVSYNRALDTNTLFIDVSAEEKHMKDITCELKTLGYLDKSVKETKVILIQLKLRDVPGSVQPVLEILDQYHVNISYMSSQSNSTDYQYFKMGILIENSSEIKKVLDALSRYCEVKILQYDLTEKVLDNTIFYLSFSNEIKELLALSQAQTEEFIVNSNKIMQILDEKNKKPIKTFDYIRKFAKFIQEYKGVNFTPIIDSKKISDNIMLHMIEPPCGSNTFILESNDELLFIDGGFPCYIREMQKLLNELLPQFENKKKSLVLTHADIDHSGLIPLFDTVYISKSCFDNFNLENKGENNFREQVETSAPYCKLSSIIVGYNPPPLEKFKILGEKSDDKPVSMIGELQFENMHFDVWEGNGGHVKGETILVCKSHKIIFTGDILVNIKGFSEEQYQFNLLAPYLMTTVNMDSKKATVIRNQVVRMSKNYLVCPGHGEFFMNDEIKD